MFVAACLSLNIVTKFPKSHSVFWKATYNGGPSNCLFLLFSDFFSGSWCKQQKRTFENFKSVLIIFVQSALIGMEFGIKFEYLSGYCDLIQWGTKVHCKLP